MHIRDFYVTTDLDDSYQDATLEVQLEVDNYSQLQKSGHQIRGRLFDGREPVAGVSSTVMVPSAPPGSSSTVNVSAEVESPAKWSAEAPKLYMLILELMDSSGEVVELLGSQVGFREVEIGDQAVLINGVPVKFNGVNSHVHHPVTGRTMDVETMRQDLILMKQFNINSVRTSHYPPNVEYLDLADKLGMYIVDETGDEAHSTTFLSELPEWRGAYLDRARKMVRRDRNHPSVVIWSAGNESGSGENICALIEEGKRIDSSRPWLYGGNNDYFPENNPLDCEDIVGPRYPTPFELKTQIGQVSASADPRPSFMDEYAAATGNSLGGMDEFWQVIYEYPRCIGGAIWDWVSPGISSKWVVTPDSSPAENEAALMGGASLVEGKFGQAIALSGHDEWVELYQTPDLDITGDQLTLQMWLTPRRWNGTGSFLTKGDHQYGLQQSSEDQLEFFIHDGKRISVYASTPEHWEDNWHSLAGIYDGNQLRLYLDGALVSWLDHSGAIDHNPFPVNVGRNAALHGQEHPGQLSNAVIDRVQIFGQALTAEELSSSSPSLKNEAVLWLDFDSVEEKGEYFSLGIGGRSYGLVWPDREVQPELWQVKKSAQPVQIQAANLWQGYVRITNRHHFKDLSDLTLKWKISGDSEVLEEGDLKVSLPAQESSEIQIPFHRPEVQPGVEYRLNVSFVLDDETDWAPGGHELAWEQMDLPYRANSAEPPSAERTASVSMQETEEEVVVSGKGFVYRFDKKSGLLGSIEFEGQDLIRKGPSMNIWRAPLANETDQWAFWRARVTTAREGMGGNVAAGWYSLGLQDLEHVVERVTANRVDASSVKVLVSTHSKPKNDSGAEFAVGFDNTYEYLVLGSGDILISHELIPHGLMPDWLPKVGLQLIIRDRFNQLAWYGRGPFETYPDRKAGAPVGMYRGTVENQYVPYLVPQDHGNKTDVRWVTLTDDKGVGLFIAGAGLLNFSAQNYSTANLTKSWYTPQLKKHPGITLNLDHRVTGVGGTAISVLNQYRVPAQQYKYKVRLRPFRSDRESPDELSKQRLPN
jgi:beta-galactosidase